MNVIPLSKMVELTEIEVFCRQVRARTRENRQAISVVHEIPGQMVAILRQELDSLVRVVFLLNQNQSYRDQLINDSINGKQWRQFGTKKRVTDREMVELSESLHNWTKSVYDFGCAFIHLSSFHDYMERDPLGQISEDEKNKIISHLRYYHGGPSSQNPTFRDIIPMLPQVFEKIASNLECYVQDLESY